MSDHGFGGLFNVGEMGRGGGVVAILVGLLLIGGAVVGARAAPWLPWGLGSVGFVMVLLGVIGFRQGQRSRVVRHMPLTALRSTVQTQELGFSVCVRCRVVMPGNLLGTCSECGWPTDCVTVSTEAERKLALAAIPSDG